MEKLDIFVIVYLDNILIYIDDNRNGHIAAVQWVLEQLRTFLLYASLKSVNLIMKKFGSLTM